MNAISIGQYDRLHCHGSFFANMYQIFRVIDSLAVVDTVELIDVRLARVVLSDLKNDFTLSTGLERYTSGAPRLVDNAWLSSGPSPTGSLFAQHK